MRTITILSTAILLAGCDLHQSLGDDLSVEPSSPLPGAGTGSANATASATPALTWTANSEADSYQVQVDGSCTTASLCSFASPGIDTTVATTSFTPSVPLAVPTTGPRSQTYCWRVRGCHQGACGSWSVPRCFVVGAAKSLNRDLNGDGYSDFVVGAGSDPSKQPKAYVYLGGPSLPARPALVVDDNLPDNYGTGVAMVGDVNGDGYGDYAVQTQHASIDGQGGTRIMVFFGGSVLKAQPDITFAPAAVQDVMLGVTGCGDLNGDGYDDIAFETVRNDVNGNTQPPRVEIHFGGPDLATSAPLVLASAHPTDVIPFSIAAAGDVNGDGYPDLVVGAGLASPGSSVGAEVLLYYGGSPMDATADVVFPNPYPSTPSTAFPVAGVGDINGDGFADVAIAVSPGAGGPIVTGGGTVDIYYGGTTPHTSPDLSLQGDPQGEGFGISILPAGDLNHDGYADFAVLAVDGGSYGVPVSGGGIQYFRNPGKVFLFAGGQAPSASAFATVSAPVSHPYVLAGAIVDANGDGEPEILVGVSDEPGTSSISLSQVIVYSERNQYQTPVRMLSGFSVGDGFGLSE